MGADRRRSRETRRRGGWRPVAVVGAVAALFAISAAAAGELARESLPGPVTVELIRVIDGDTIVVRAHPWIGVFVETHVRVDGIDAPELHGRCEREKLLAEQARDRLMALLAGGDIRLGDVHNDKYGGRVRARVYDAAGVDVGGALVAAGLARPYHGEHRAPWCDAG